MEWYVLVIVFLSFTVVISLIAIVRMVFLIEDLRLENKKMCMNERAMKL